MFRKKNPRRTNYSSIFSAKVQNLAVLNHLHDSNSIFRAAGINSEGGFGRTVLCGTMNPSTLTDNYQWKRSWSLWMDPSEPHLAGELPPVWNGRAETWDDSDREVTLWTDSFDPRQALALGRRLEEHWRGSSQGIAAKLREMLEPTLEKFAAYGVRLNECHREVGNALSHLDNTHDAARSCTRDQGNSSAFENNGLNGSQVSAVLAIQENSFWSRGIGRIMRSSNRINDVKKSHPHHGDGWSAEIPGDNVELAVWKYS